MSIIVIYYFISEKFMVHICPRCGTIACKYAGKIIKKDGFVYHKKCPKTSSEEKAKYSALLKAKKKLHELTCL